MKQKIVSIEATTLDDAWFQVIYNIMKYGREFVIDEGSYAGSIRRELDFVMIHITRPFERENGFPRIPRIPEHMNIPQPVADDYLIDYASYLLTGEMTKNESYTYGQRLNKEPVSRDIADRLIVNDGIYRNYPGGNVIEHIVLDRHKFLSQVDLAIEVFKKNPRTNQMCLQVAKPTDMLLLDPPCLRTIDMRIQDNKLHFNGIHFRSWDAWGGLPANLAGISMLQEHMADEIGVEQGEMIAISKGLHLYDYNIPVAEVRCMVENKC